jgi:hypothetical protein
MHAEAPPNRYVYDRIKPCHPFSPTSFTALVKESISPTLPPTKLYGEDNRSSDRSLFYEELDLRRLYRGDLNPQI